MFYRTEQLFEHYPELTVLKDDIYRTCNLLKDAFEADKTLFVCGNGGSAADAEHIAGELLKGFLKRRHLPEKIQDKFKKLYTDEGEILSSSLQEGLRTISLNGHPSLSTAFANDVNSSYIFAQQLYVLGRPGDVILGISTSGKAQNIYAAFQVARVKNIKTVLLTGQNPGICAEIADVIIKAPAEETYRIQEYHLPVYHAICAEIEEHFYGKGK